GQQTRLGELQSALAQARAQIDQATELAQSTRESLNGRVTELAGNGGQRQAALQRLNGQFGQQLQGLRADLAGDIRDEAQARAQLANRIAALEQGGQNTNVVNSNLNGLNERIGQVARGL